MRSILKPLTILSAALLCQIICYAEDSGATSNTDLPAGTQVEALINKALAYKALGRYDQAIDTLELIFRTEVDDSETAGHIIEGEHNSRHRAQWEIGNCLFAQKNYKGALEAYRLAETKYPSRCWCGTCAATSQSWCVFYQGLCNEWLGDPVSAVKLYFKAMAEGGYLAGSPMPSVRIFEIYEAAGQLIRLERLLNSINRQDSFRRILSDTMSSLLLMREMEQQEHWPALLSFLKAKRALVGPHVADDRYYRNWEAVQAAKLLARHSRHTVPLLIAKLETADADDARWLYYALGLCGTCAAVQTLKASVLKETDLESTNAAVYALSLAGTQGEAALDELADLADGHLKTSITLYREGKIGDRDQDIQFPEISRAPPLPRTLEDLAID